MFANTLRRLALASTRHVSAVRHQAVQRQPTTVFSRGLSTSHALRLEDDDGEFGRTRFGSGETSFRRELPPSNTLYVGNMPYSTDERELRALFASFGEIKSVRIGVLPDGRARGFGHVEFVELDDAVNARESVRNEPLQILDRDAVVDYAPTRTGPPAPNRKLYVTEFNGDEEELRALFRDFESSITNVHILMNPRTGTTVSAGFVEFENIERATEAMASINSNEGEGAKPKVEYARLSRLRSVGDNYSRKSYGGEWGQRGSSEYGGSDRGSRGGRGRGRGRGGSGRY